MEVGQAVLLASRLSSRLPALRAKKILENFASSINAACRTGNPKAQSLFVTWSLDGSVPSHRYLFPQGLTSGPAFVWMGAKLATVPAGSAREDSRKRAGQPAGVLPLVQSVPAG